jgi:hypothetical protein
MEDFPISRFAGAFDAIGERGGGDHESPYQRARSEARSEARRIIETHYVDPLPEDQEAALLKIAERTLPTATA